MPFVTSSQIAQNRSTFDKMLISTGLPFVQSPVEGTSKCTKAQGWKHCRCTVCSMPSTGLSAHLAREGASNGGVLTGGQQRQPKKDFRRLGPNLDTQNRQLR